MSVLDAFAVSGGAPDYVPPPKPKTSAWADVGKAVTAVPRGIGEAAAQVMGTAADLAGAYRAMRDATPEQRKALDRGGLPPDAFSSDLGDSLRDRGREFRPDPETASTAEQILYGFSRGATKIIGGAVVGGVPGVIAAGAEEGFSTADDLRRQGVDFDTRGKAGLVQGAGLALAALPAAGQTLMGTLGLYAAGGPGGFMAQQALTREILQSAGYDKIGMGFDPLDPVGLAVSALIPAGFAAYGFRQAKIAQAVKSLPDLPRDAPAAAPDSAPPSDLSPVTKAVKQYPQEVEDAARVLYQAEVRESANPGAGIKAANDHAAALSRAEDQLARGEPVQVADVAPAPAVRVTDTPEFRAWFGDSKVVDESGAPLRVFHVTTSEFDAFRTEGNSTNAGDRLDAAFFTDSADYADAYAVEKRGRSPATVPAFVSMKNPLVVDAPANGFADPRFEQPIIARARAEGYDGVVFRDAETGANFYAVFRPEQIKSATGNTRFDPNSPSLTDSPYATWEAQIRAAVSDMRKAEPSPMAEPTTPVANAQQLDALFAQTKPAATEPGAAFDAAATVRLDAIREQHPDLMVQLDGMDAPMRMDDFLAAAKAEADEMTADAPLMRAAAECALTFGV